MRKKILIAAALLWTLSAQCDTFTVNTTLDSVDASPGDGLCQDGSGACSLRAAVMESNAWPGDEVIELAMQTTYTLTLASAGSDTDADGDLDVVGNLTIRAVDAAEWTGRFDRLPVIDANGLDRAVQIFGPGNAVTLQGLVLTGGNADASTWGGGVFAGSGVSQVRIERSVITGNSARAAGGLYSEAEVTQVLQSEISYNQITDSSSTSFRGTAILNRAGELRIESSSIHHNNVAPSYVFCTTAIEHHHSESDYFLINSTVSDNGIEPGQPAQCVGGTLVMNGSLYMLNSTVTGNGFYGLDFFDFEPDADQYTLMMRHSIVANNLSRDCDGFSNGLINLGDADGGHNIIGDGTCPLPVAPGNLDNTDPMLMPLAPINAHSDYFQVQLPMPGSPAIDAGNPLPHDAGNDNTCRAVDNRMAPRPLDHSLLGTARCDIGSVELYDVIFKNSVD